MDSHFIGQGQHIYFGNMSGVGVSLDRDDTSAYGPETITIDLNTAPKGTYEYFVRWYSGTGTWGTSRASVEVLIGSEVIAKYYVPNDLSMQQRDWKVFRIDTIKREVIGIDQ